MEVRINDSFRVMHFGRDGVGGWGRRSHGWRKAWLDPQMIQIRLLLFTAESAGAEGYSENEDYLSTGKRRITSRGQS